MLLSEKDTLSSALDTAIGAVESQIQTLRRKINYYYGKWYDVTVPISAHNRAHSSPSESNHSWNNRKTYQYNDDLPEFSCFGGCGTTMSTPGRAETLHQLLCGPTLLTTGCGEKYYSCPPDYSIPDWHRVFNCTNYNKVIKNGEWVKEFCKTPFQFCANSSCSKRLGTGIRGEHSHSDPSSTANSKSGSISPDSGSSYASAGSSYTVDLTTSTPFSSVYWYIKRTGTSGLGSSIETDNGGSSSYSASMTYTFGSSDSGDYIITAYIYDYSDNSTYQVEHTVNVSDSSYTPPSTPSTPSTPPSSAPCVYCSDEDLEVVCTKCGATYHRCTSAPGDCPEGDGYHYSDYAWQQQYCMFEHTEKLFQPTRLLSLYSGRVFFLDRRVLLVASLE